jgi:hypothetical protein
MIIRCYYMTNWLIWVSRVDIGYDMKIAYKIWLQNILQYLLFTNYCSACWEFVFMCKQTIKKIYTIKNLAGTIYKYFRYIYIYIYIYQKVYINRISWLYFANYVSTLDRFLLYICCIYIHYIKMNFKIKPHDSLYSIFMSYAVESTIRKTILTSITH